MEVICSRQSGRRFLAQSRNLFMLEEISKESRKFRKNLLASGKIERLVYLLNIFKVVRNFVFSEQEFQIFIFSPSEFQI
jgi:hypothetical protein